MKFNSKIVSFALSLTLLFSMTACGMPGSANSAYSASGQTIGNGKTTAQEETVQNTQQIIIQNGQTQNTSAPGQDQSHDNDAGQNHGKFASSEFEITELGNFRNGYAEIMFENDGKEYKGIIDSKGNLMFAIDPSAYDVRYVYDTDGTVVAAGALENVNVNGYVHYEGVISAGNGYYVTQENSSDFNRTLYTVQVHDIQGNVCYEYSSSDPLSALYDDYGIFVLYNGGCSFFVFTDTDSGTVQESDLPFMGSSDSWCSGTQYSGSVVYGCCKGDSVYFYDKNGSLYSYTFDFTEGSLEAVSGDYALVFDEDSRCYYTINALTGACVQYGGAWYSRLYLRGRSVYAGNKGQDLSFSSGNAAFKLQGADGGYYIGIVDSDMTELCDPIPISGEDTKFTLADGFLRVEDGTVYDLNGKERGSISSSYAMDCDDGFYHLDLSGGSVMNGASNPLYINADGSAYITEINFSTCRTIAENQ